MVNRRREVLRFRIELLGIRPTIWRELLVPASYSFWDLHVALQDAMGWWDSHLHQFEVGEDGAGGSVRIGIPVDEFDDDPDLLAGWEIAVLECLDGPGSTMDYEYDFGDGWVHRLTYLGCEPREKGGRYPRCVAGERACPPEDCGGVGGYEHLVEALLDPSNPEHEELMEWIPRGWMPEGFSPEAVRFDSPSRRWKLAFEDE